MHVQVAKVNMLLQGAKSDRESKETRGRGGGGGRERERARARERERHWRGIRNLKRIERVSITREPVYRL